MIYTYIVAPTMRQPSSLKNSSKVSHRCTRRGSSVPMRTRSYMKFRFCECMRVCVSFFYSKAHVLRHTCVCMCKFRFCTCEPVIRVDGLHDDVW